MYLKTLGLEGFKSFADATEIQFNNGFTAIVGPNGCGKSNVSDAIRWVIGEQSSKSLRGTKSVDLIFNGSGSRKPLNRAEISLTLASVPQGLRIANIPNVSDEVKVTRRYYRSGESEFYINQIPCRLKDITDFLLDVGISPKVLTVIEQGHIHEIITAKPENRRILIEEAAGILKFKHRRHEAERKLEASEQNLARIGDIVKELGRQAESLKRQSAKAERYKTFQSEVKDLSLQIFSKKYVKLAKDLEVVEGELASAQQLKEEHQARSEVLSTRSVALKLEIETAHQTLNETREQIHQFSLTIGRNEQTLKSNNDRIVHLGADNEKAESDIVEMNRDIEHSVLETEQRRTELGGYSERLNKEGDELEAQKQALGDKKNLLRELQDKVNSLENKINQLQRSLSDKKSKSAAVEARCQFLQDQEGEKANEMEELAC
jgi:chromosome segregation protein